jgi:hypothetical protein
MNFTQKRLYTKKSVATNLYNLIKMIFNEYYNYAFFITKEKDNSLIKTTHKGLTYEDYNKFFGSDFAKQPSSDKDFSEGNIVDIYAEKKESNGKICKKVWVNGKISGIDPDANRGIYNVIYYKSDNKNSKCSIKFPKSTLEIDDKGAKTEYLENKFKLYNPNKLTIIDYCLETNKQKIWCTAKICDIDNETKDDELKFLKYKLDIENYDYNVIQENEVGFYDGMEQNGMASNSRFFLHSNMILQNSVWSGN